MSLNEIKIAPNNCCNTKQTYIANQNELVEFLQIVQKTPYCNQKSNDTNLWISLLQSMCKINRCKNNMNFVSPNFAQNNYCTHKKQSLPVDWYNLIE